MLSNNLTQNIYQAFDLLQLTSDHANTYISLLEEGLCTTTKLSKYSDIPRTTFYDLLENLIDWNLVQSQIIKKKTLYQCTEPYHLLDQVILHKNKCDDIAYSLKRNLYELENIYLKKLEQTQIDTVDLDSLDINSLTNMLFGTRSLSIITNTEDEELLDIIEEITEKLYDIEIKIQEIILKATKQYIKIAQNSSKQIKLFEIAKENDTSSIKIISDDIIIKFNKYFYSIDKDIDGIKTERLIFESIFKSDIFK